MRSWVVTPLLLGCASATPLDASVSFDAGAADGASPVDRATPPTDAGSPAMDTTDVPAPPDVAVDVAVDARPAGYGLLGRVAREGDTVTLRTHRTVNYRGVDGAYDPVHRVFLVVYGNAPIGGAFLDDDGRQLGDGFQLTTGASDGSDWTQLPRVAWGGGGFLVSWHHETGRMVVPEARRVEYGAAGPTFGGGATAIGTGGSMQESPIGLAWSPEAGEFLAVWAQSGVKARRLGPDGAPHGEVVVVSEEGTWAEQPSVVWSAAARSYFVAFMQESGGAARVALQRIDARGSLAGSLRDLTGPLAFAKVTDVEYDAAAGEVVASWYQVRGAARGFAAQRLGGDGEPRGPATDVFQPHGSYDGYDLAWSAATGTSLAAFHGDGAEDMGAELDGALRSSTPFAVTASGARNGNFIPRVVAHPARPLWLVLSSADYARVVLQRIAWSPR